METVSMGEAARRVGRSKGTLSKAIAAGRLRYAEKTKSGYLIALDELERVFPPRDPSTSTRSSSPETGVVRSDDDARMLRIELDLIRQQLEDVRADRDAWRELAMRQTPTDGAQ